MIAVNLFRILISIAVLTDVRSQAPTVEPSRAPTTSISPITSSGWLTLSYFSDSLCTEYAGQTSFAVGGCDLMANSDYLQTSYTLNAGIYDLVVDYYSDSACTVTTSAPPVNASYDSTCELYDGRYQLASTSVDMPVSFPSSGSLSTLYSSGSNCGSAASALVVTLVADENTVCIPLYNGNYGDDATCGANTVAYLSDTQTCTNATAAEHDNDVCSSNQYSTFLGFAGDTEFECYSVGSNSGGSRHEGSKIGIAIAVVFFVVVLC